MKANTEFDSQDYLKKAKEEIGEWETRKPGFIAQVGDAVLSPVMRQAGKLVPEGVQTAVSEAVEKTLRLTAKAGEFTVDGVAINKERIARLKNARTLGKKLNVSDQLANGYWNWHLGYAAAEGGATGAAGIFGLPADIPLILSIAIREIRTIGACYGYETNSPTETDYVLHILRIGSSGDINVKIQFLIALKEFEQILLKVAWKKMTQEMAAKQLSKGAVLAAIREFAKSLGIQLTKRKALQAVPIVGALIGASFNAVYANDIGRAAFMCYRRRFIEENAKQEKVKSRRGSK